MTTVSYHFESPIRIVLNAASASAHSTKSACRLRRVKPWRSAVGNSNGTAATSRLKAAAAANVTIAR